MENVRGAVQTEIRIGTCPRGLFEATGTQAKTTDRFAKMAAVLRANETRPDRKIIKIIKRIGVRASRHRVIERRNVTTWDHLRNTRPGIPRGCCRNGAVRVASRDSRRKRCPDHPGRRGRDRPDWLRSTCCPARQTKRVQGRDPG